MKSRVVNLGRMASEKFILEQHAASREEFVTSIPMVNRRPHPNPVAQDVLGMFREPEARKAVIADSDLLRRFTEAGLGLPAFLEAGPRAFLQYDPQRVRAAIVTTGGLAPGLNAVVHSIVKRHIHTYSSRANGKVLGVYNSFKGLCRLADSLVDLEPEKTEHWLDQGGSNLGNVRYFGEEERGQASIDAMVRTITQNLAANNIDILYVIGGDGSMEMAHNVAIANPTRSIVGIPKTMDNDILWVWQSFGFDTAVEQATRVINTLRSEAESTRRICLIELFGAQSGFVAANAALASGHVDLVLIPEVFHLLSREAAQNYLDECVRHIAKVVQGERHNPHALIVVAEGVGTALHQKGASFGGEPVSKNNFIHQLSKVMAEEVRNAHDEKMLVFDNEPRHNIRAVPANAHDQIYCERLGALAVDNALAGYTDFMISQWLTEFVLVPLRLVGGHQKSIPVNGMFWKQVVSSTAQPLSPAEIPAFPDLTAVDTGGAS